MSHPRARIDTMKPSRPGPTRTAPPRMPDQFWTGGRYRAYIAFGACGFFLMMVSFLLLRVVWVLGRHDPAAWQDLFESFANPIYVLFHLVSLVALVWFGLRFFKVFPKTQPAKIGPFPRPPDAFFAVALNGAFVVATALGVALLWGALG